MFKRIVVGVTGGVAAYKTVGLVRLLRDAGISVRVVMTESASAFVTPLTFQACSGHRVYTKLIDPDTSDSMAHIDLSRWADCIIIAPATANFIAKCANGFADDLLSTLFMASKVPVFIAPAMNVQMWNNLSVQNNLSSLKQSGVLQLGPASGQLACGDVGLGRMIEPEDILKALIPEEAEDGFWCNKKVLITAGPTHEAVDPIRFLGNNSSGKMGYALAESLVMLGAKVTLISGPTQITKPSKVHVLYVVTALEMYETVMSAVENADVFISAAAVANYRPEKPSKEKIKSKAARLSLSLIENPDIVATVAALEKKPIVIGFAAETEHVLESAKEKLQRKKLDLIIANQVGYQQGMGVDVNAASLISNAGELCAFPCLPKKELAFKLLSAISEALTPL